ncbi:MAG: TonB family protein [Mucilaginibacter sp.]
MNWLHYLVEANIYLSVFYLFYCLLLNKETHYTLNRIYLLSSCMLSFILPLMQIGRLKPVETMAQNALPITIEPSNVVYTSVPIQTAPVVEASDFTLQDAILCAYLVGTLVLLVLFTIKLYKLLKLSHAKATATDDGYKLVYINESNTAFSFFNYLFIGKNAPGAETIIRHELVHIRQKHSADIILLEVIKIINWFNPLIYLLQQSLKTVHEYIADEQTAAAETDTLAYSTFLVNNAYGLSGSPITNSFFNYNLLKKRIMMLHQQRSGGLARLKYLLAAPLCAALLCVSTLGFSKTYNFIDLAPSQAAPKPAAGKVVTVKADSASTTKPRRSSITSKGYRYKEDGYLVKNKSDFRVIIFEKNGEGKTYFRNSATAAELKLLEEKYGYTFPNMEIYATPPPPPPMAPAPPVQVKFPHPVVHSPAKTSGTVKFPPPIVKPDKLADTAFEPFYHQLAMSIHYPSQARENNITGKVFAQFTVDADHHVMEVGVLRAPEENLANEVIRAIKACGAVPAAKTGINYTIPVNFTLTSKNGGYVKTGTIAPSGKQYGTLPPHTETNLALSEIVVVGYGVEAK